MIVLVTGTLVPRENVFALQLVDRDKRIGEYAESLKKLMVAKSVDKVVFCENSGDEQAVEKLREQLYDGKPENKLEILSFQGDGDKVAKYGKGYGEGQVIKYALHNSRFLKNEKDYRTCNG